MLPIKQAKKQLMERRAAQRKLNFDTPSTRKPHPSQGDVYPIRCENFDIQKIRFEVIIIYKICYIPLCYLTSYSHCTQISHEFATHFQHRIVIHFFLYFCYLFLAIFILGISWVATNAPLAFLLLAPGKRQMGGLSRG